MLVGPTASGKSAVALRLARRLGASILSVDSMQVYRGMDIGTAKPSVEERREIRHHMIDLVDPSDEYTVAEFQAAARDVLGGEGPVIVAGGSGLHMRAVLDPLEFSPHDPQVRRRLETSPLEELRSRLLEDDPLAGDHVDLENPRRVVRAVEILEVSGETPSARASTEAARDVASYRPLIPFRAAGLDPGDGVAERVRARVEEMRDAGLLEEVAGLAPVLGRTAAQAVGYKELLPVVAGELDEAAGFSAVTEATLGLVRRQRTYFRRDPRISWVEWCEDEEALADRVLETWEGASPWSS